MFFFVLLFVGVFCQVGGGSVDFCLYFCLAGFVWFNYHRFGALEGPVPRKEKEGEQGALTRFREEGVE